MNCQRLVPLIGTRTFFSGPEAMMSSSPIRSFSCSVIFLRRRSRWCCASRRPASCGSPDSLTTVIRSSAHAAASSVEQMAEIAEQVTGRVLGVPALLDQDRQPLIEPLGLFAIRVGLGDRDLDDVLQLVEQVLLDPGGQ